MIISSRRETMWRKAPGTCFHYFTHVFIRLMRWDHVTVASVGPYRRVMNTGAQFTSQFPSLSKSYAAYSDMAPLPPVAWARCEPSKLRGLPVLPLELVTPGGAGLTYAAKSLATSHQLWVRSWARQGTRAPWPRSGRSSSPSSSSSHREYSDRNSFYGPRKSTPLFQVLNLPSPVWYS